MSIGPNSTKLEERAELARQTAQYLASGGRIEFVPSDVMRREGKYGSWKHQDEIGNGFTHGKTEIDLERKRARKAAAKSHESRRADRRVMSREA